MTCLFLPFEELKLAIAQVPKLTTLANPSVGHRASRDLIARLPVLEGKERLDINLFLVFVAKEDIKFH
jgi:hypothetical protein